MTNLEDKQIEPAKPRLFPKIFWAFLIILVLTSGLLFAKAYNLSSKVFVSHQSFVKKLENLLFAGRFTKLQGEDSNRINILLLGYGGVGHDGPYLTDSIILVSIKPDSKEVLLTSIPRDYLLNGEKINSAFAIGLSKNNDFDEAGQEVRSAAKQLSGQDIPYFASMDFEGFKQAVDRVGGLDVNVDNTFTDRAFPNDATNGYLPPITFNAGMQHMDGQRALEYARSRHAQGPEGSDFARSKRQEKVLAAFKDKMKNLNLLSDTTTINDLLNIVSDHFHTNLEPDEIIHLTRILRSPDTKIVSQSLDETTGLICQNISDTTGEFILFPCPGVSDQQIQDFFSNGFTATNLAPEKASVIIEDAGNGSQYSLLRDALKRSGVDVYEVPYKGLPLDKSVLYEVNAKPQTEQFIEKLLNINSQPKPPELVAKTDLVLMVGKE